MGCASSKQKKKCCRHCGKAPSSPVRRSYSLHVHHPPQHSGDSYHVVALTSSTLGSLKLEIPNNSTLTIKEEEDVIRDEKEFDYDLKAIKRVDSNPIGVDLRSREMTVKEITKEQLKDFSKELVEARNWSNMIGEKIPKIGPRTPIRTPPGEPETINAWELMEGLEDTSPYLSPKHFRSFSFDVAREPSMDSPVRLEVKSDQEDGVGSPKTVWHHSTTDDETDSKTSTVISDFDPEIISSFRKALEDLPPENPFQLRPQVAILEAEKTFQDSPLKKTEEEEEDDNNSIKYPSTKEKVVLYFTSLRGVRKTYEDCCNVKLILKSIGLRIDERDVSMDSGFKEELKQLLGEGFSRGGLPRVFVGTKYIGDAEEIKRLHEEGKLEKLLQGCAMIDDYDGNGVCEACGDIRFVPCETCSGSCKIYYEEEDDENDDEEDDDDHDEEDGEDEAEGGFQRCPDCNENGLIRCPICCD